MKIFCQWILSRLGNLLGKSFGTPKNQVIAYYMCCSCTNLSYSLLYYYNAHVGQVEASVYMSAMVTGLVGFEPCLEHFPFYPFLCLYSTQLVQYHGPAPTCKCHCTKSSLHKR